MPRPRRPRSTSLPPTYSAPLHPTYVCSVLELDDNDQDHQQLSLPSTANDFPSRCLSSWASFNGITGTKFERINHLVQPHDDSFDMGKTFYRKEAHFVNDQKRENEREGEKVEGKSSHDPQACFNGTGSYLEQLNDHHVHPHDGLFVSEDSSNDESFVWEDVSSFNDQKSDEEGEHGQASSRRLSKSSNSDSSSSSKYTYLHHLTIGDVSTSPQDMLPQGEYNTGEIDYLQKHDFAFILRSDGCTWTYAIIADRQDDWIRFVVDVNGSTKIMTRKKWHACVRIVNVENQRHASVSFASVIGFMREALS